MLMIFQAFMTFQLAKILPLKLGMGHDDPSRIHKTVKPRDQHD